MNSPQQENSKMMSQAAIRAGLVVSAITVFTFVWTALMQPILTLQQQVQLLTYRVNVLEKALESMSRVNGDRERPSQSLENKQLLEAQKEIP